MELMWCISSLEARGTLPGSVKHVSAMNTFESKSSSALTTGTVEECSRASEGATAAKKAMHGMVIARSHVQKALRCGRCHCGG